MTRDEFLAVLGEYRTRMGAISAAKNADYCADADPFANFTQSETTAGVSTEQGFLVRMGDKMARIKTFVLKGVLQVKDESVEDTLLDLANYSLILAAYIKGKRNGNRHENAPGASDHNIRTQDAPPDRSISEEVCEGSGDFICFGAS